MLEALIVYPLTMFLLFFVLALFSVLFQRWNLQVIANESAMRMAQTYRLSSAEESSGFVTEEQLTDVGAYRYVANVITKEMETSIKERVSSYAKWRLARTTYTKDVTEPQVSVTVVPDTMGRRHLEVTIVGEYAVPFGEALAFFGFNGTITYEVSAYADCLDIVDYIGLVDYVGAQTSFNSGIIDMIDSFLKLGDHIIDMGEEAETPADGGGFR